MAAVFVFGLLVLVHELGHFATAKLTDMRVDEFAIGFGPKIFSRRYGETVYSLRAVPLGGFNDIAGMMPEDNDAGSRGYCRKPIPSRLLVISAGSLMNFVLPIFLFFSIFFFSGVNKVLPDPIIGEVVANKPAAEAGLMAGDRIVKIGDTTVDSWQAITTTIGQSDTQKIAVTYERDGEQHVTTITPYYDSNAKRSLIGIISRTEITHPGFLESVGLAFKTTTSVIGAMVTELMRIIGQPDDANLAGPIGVAQMAGQFAERGFVPLLNFAALLSLNLGIINLLPVPALDGGHIVALMLEAVRGKPMSQKVLGYTQNFGVALLILLMLFATKNDIIRIFTGS